MHAAKHSCVSTHKAFCTMYPEYPETTAPWCWSRDNQLKGLKKNFILWSSRVKRLTTYFRSVSVKIDDKETVSNNKSCVGMDLQLPFKFVVELLQLLQTISLLRLPVCLQSENIACNRTLSVFECEE